MYEVFKTIFVPNLHQKLLYSLPRYWPNKKKFPENDNYAYKSTKF
jgi:hypothetical protein